MEIILKESQLKLIIEDIVQNISEDTPAVDENNIRKSLRVTPKYTLILGNNEYELHKNVPIYGWTRINVYEIRWRNDGGLWVKGGKGWTTKESVLPAVDVSYIISRVGNKEILFRDERGGYNNKLVKL